MGNVLGRIPLVGRYFRSATPTSEDVVAFWAAMQQHYASTRIDKSKASEMAGIAQLLDLLGVVKKQDFLTRFTTVIDDRIYTPFEPGTPTRDWSLWGQIMVCVREHEHIRQDRASGGLGFKWNYITNPAQRAHYEAEAYRCDMVLEWRYQGRVLDAYRISRLLLSYGCTMADADVAERMLLLSVPSIKAGAIPSDVAGWACQWLDERWHR
jgi:hypothetical protein